MQVLDYEQKGRNHYVTVGFDDVEKKAFLHIDQGKHPVQVSGASITTETPVGEQRALISRATVWLLKEIHEKRIALW